jgi:hypothetical protein
MNTLAVHPAERVGNCTHAIPDCDALGCTPKENFSLLFLRLTAYNPKLAPLREQVLSWIDICAGLAAKSVAGGPCVTASVDAVHFLRPVRVGSVAIVAAMVNRTFNSSMEVRTNADSCHVC